MFNIKLPPLGNFKNIKKCNCWQLMPSVNGEHPCIMSKSLDVFLKYREIILKRGHEIHI